MIRPIYVLKCCSPFEKHAACSLCIFSNSVSGYAYQVLQCPSRMMGFVGMKKKKQYSYHGVQISIQLRVAASVGPVAEGKGRPLFLGSLSSYDVPVAEGASRCCNIGIVHCHTAEKRPQCLSLLAINCVTGTSLTTSTVSSTDRTSEKKQNYTSSTWLVIESPTGYYITSFALYVLRAFG